ncbi:hypothetical protein AF332_11410 [Sporosarcina globispora]|uniref:Uncharacterized protein n=1 Tax=Sporosarcina globispora TaxID=1459 RepID=A0A0M0GD65_SPOGL|nr:hypothetical protein [Sporosarcina globispora]KON87371.1 hypothetical protein AF332_11410 [Sporosarcina globispora]
MSKRLSFSTIETKFKELNPFGQITKQSNNTYWIYFDARDNRSEAEKELETWGTKTDKRKIYTYKASSLIQLAHKLKLDISEYEEYKLSKVNQEWEEMLKIPYIENDEDPLFFE